MSHNHRHLYHSMDSKAGDDGNNNDGACQAWSHRNCGGSGGGRGGYVSYGVRESYSVPGMCDCDQICVVVFGYV